MRNSKLVRFYLVIVLISCSLCSNAQRFDSLLSKLYTQYNQEKLYLHFDRSVYTAGETIWFKAYLFAGYAQSVISKTIYAELLDDKGKVLQRKTAPAMLSSAAASFDLPKDFSGSLVYIRAYTKWMLNFDSSFIYSKAIPILNSKQTGSKPISLPQRPINTVSNQSPTFYLQLFPEGGDLVEQVESRVAFKATNGTGIPANITGNIIDSKKNKITSFSSGHDGMGTFILQPKAAEKYTAVWKDMFGLLHETALPAAKQNGVVLEVNNTSNQIEFKVKRLANGDLFYPFVYIVAQMNQQLLYRAKANLSKTITASGIIPSENLPSGIVQLTVFTPDEKPVAERITFINPSASSFITDLNAASKDLNKRKKNVIQIDVPDTILTNLSVAITDADLDPVQQADNIISSVFLTSDIKGYVHNPAYYFSSEADSVLDHLDLVMMTNGWRRFKWEDALSGHFPAIKYKPENYLSIEGRMYGVNKTLMVNKEINSIIQLKNGNNQFLNTSLQPDGKFIFPDMIFYDTAKFYYQLNNDKRQSLTTRANFDIKNNFLIQTLRYRPDSSLLLTIPATDTAVLAKSKEIYQEELKQEEFKVKVLKGVVVTTRKRTKEQIMDDEYTSGFFSGGNATTIVADDDPAFASSQNLLQYLQSRIAGLQISLGGSNPSITWRGSATSLFLNEISAEVDMIQNMPMSDVAMVKIFSPPFFGAVGGGGGGAIAVYQKKGVSAGQSVKGLDYVNIAGYSAIKEFYSPDYSKPDETANADLRKTLYWNPFVITDKKTRRIFLSFYNNDITKKIKIIIEGCNEDGKLTRIEKVLQ